jgi:hypothetical protein
MTTSFISCRANRPCSLFFRIFLWFFAPTNSEEEKARKKRLRVRTRVQPFFFPSLAPRRLIDCLVSSLCRMPNKFRLGNKMALITYCKRLNAIVALLWLHIVICFMLRLPTPREEEDGDDFKE